MQRKRMASNTVVNVDKNERLLSLVGGGILALYGVARLPLSAVAVVLGGGYLLYRGITGHCYIYRVLDINKAVVLERSRGSMERFRNEPPPSVEQSDAVTEASWEAYPNGDPPS
jgi:hypothetical protein